MDGWILDGLPTYLSTLPKVKTDDKDYLGEDHSEKLSLQVKTDEKDRAIGVLVFFWIITVLDMIASISVIGALV